MAFVFLVYKLSRPIKERLFVYFFSNRHGALSPVTNEPLDGEYAVVFDIYKLAAPERHDIDIMVAR